jgi:DUSAM domain-containing protein
MNDRAKPVKDDWEQLRDLMQTIGEDGDLDPTGCRELLMRVVPTIGVTSEECEAALGTARGAADLVRKARRCIDEGSARFHAALVQSRDLQEHGNRKKEARRVLQEFIDREAVLFFREMAEYELGDLEGMHVIAEREYGFVAGSAGQAGKVILRIGAPEQEAPSDWVLPFEILGPEQERIESAVHGLDAVQVLHCGLQRIAVELRSLQERTGGTLTVFEKDGSGFESGNT